MFIFAVLKCYKLLYYREMPSIYWMALVRHSILSGIHKGLLSKLKYGGLTCLLLEWFQNYLSGHKQRVVLPGGASNWVIIAGVPQGSIFEPLLFLIYINDIVNDTNSSLCLFADDTSLYIIVDSPDNASNTLNQDPAKISS